MSQQTEMVKAHTAQQKGEMDLRKGEIAIQKELIKAATPKPIKQTGGGGQ